MAKGSVGSCKTYSRGCLTFHKEHLQSAPGVLMGTNLPGRAVSPPVFLTLVYFTHYIFLDRENINFYLAQDSIAMHGILVWPDS